MNTRKTIDIEVCATSINSAIAAERGGAKRIELCDNIHEGGTTPSFANISLAQELLNIDVCVLIRPRGGDFLYNDLEFQLMKRDIEMAKGIGVTGVVIGILDKNGLVDMRRMKELLDIARPMHVVFHRAFDMAADPLIAFNQLLELGVDRLLTSGQRNTAIEGVGLIRKLVSIADRRIDIMPGSGINTVNFKDLVEKTGALDFHLTGRGIVESEMSYRSDDVVLNSFGHRDDFDRMETNPSIISEIVRLSKLR